MRRLLLVVCWLAAAQTVCARKPAVRFDLPYTLERGKYVVTVETAAGPRRFAFDTGGFADLHQRTAQPRTGTRGVGPGTSGDFEGHRHAITYVRVPYLRMGEATYSDRQVISAARQLLYLPLSGLRRHCGQRSAARLRRADAQCRLDDHAGGRPAPARRVPLPGAVRGFILRETFL